MNEQIKQIETMIATLSTQKDARDREQKNNHNLCVAIGGLRTAVEYLGYHAQRVAREQAVKSPTPADAKPQSK